MARMLQAQRQRYTSSLLRFSSDLCAFQLTPALQSAITQDDEAAAMEAMFKAQSANWEETQEKMSQ